MGSRITWESDALRGREGFLEKDPGDFQRDVFSATWILRDERQRVSRLEDWMAHTFFSREWFLSRVVSGGFGLVLGWESSQGRRQCPERVVPVGGIAWLDS